VLCAFFHDLGMGLSSEERQARLAPESDLWDKLDLLDGQRRALHYLGKSFEKGTPVTQNSLSLREYWSRAKRLFSVWIAVSVTQLTYGMRKCLKLWPRFGKRATKPFPT
jgi:hypothetical protein